MAGVWPAYIGPALPAMPEGESVDYWGRRMRRTQYPTGAYDEQYHYPLAEARTIDDLERYPWPRADWFDFSKLRAQAQEGRARQAVCAGYMTPYFMHNLLRGLELSLMDPYDDPAFTHHFLRRCCSYLLDFHRRMFQECAGLIDLAQVTDDLGTQTGPMISLEVFREFYKPWMARFIALCREFGIRVFHHDDGAIRAFLPDLVEIGIDVLNPIQWRCPGMDVEGLKRDFGHRIAFHGGVDNQQTLPHGTPDEVRAEVRHLIDALASDGTGFVLAPCHNIQAVTPVENVLAMYDEAWNYGKR
jgi:uroporphyrinogen decarboxylase